MTNKRADNDNGKSEILGSLHCAAHDEAVSSFGRDDVRWWVVRTDNGKSKNSGNVDGKSDCDD
jgi:hypothetical protein